MGSPQTKGKVEAENIAPDFTLPSRSGEEVSPKNFLGKGSPETPLIVARSVGIDERWEGCRSALRAAGMKSVGPLTEALSPFFHPKVDAPERTKAACAFGDDHEQFGAPRAEVIRVASDSVKIMNGSSRNLDCPSPCDKRGEEAMWEARRAWDLPWSGNVCRRRGGGGERAYLLPTRRKNVEEALKALGSIGLEDGAYADV